MRTPLCIPGSLISMMIAQYQLEDVCVTQCGQSLEYATCAWCYIVRELIDIPRVPLSISGWSIKKRLWKSSHYLQNPKDETWIFAFLQGSTDFHDVCTTPFVLPFKSTCHLQSIPIVRFLLDQKSLSIPFLTASQALSSEVMEEVPRNSASQRVYTLSMATVNVRHACWYCF